MRLYYGVWGALLVWSVCSLLFYRAPAGHGPDMVGAEISRFGLPLCLAFLVSLVGFALPHPVDNAARVMPFAATIILAILEAFTYAQFVMR